MMNDTGLCLNPNGPQFHGLTYSLYADPDRVDKYQRSNGKCHTASSDKEFDSLEIVSFFP